MRKPKPDQSTDTAATTLQTFTARELLDVVKLSLTLKPETFAMPELAIVLGVHPQTARDWERRGILPPPVIKVGRTVRWSRAQLDKFIAEGVTA